MPGTLPDEERVNIPAATWGELYMEGDATCPLTTYCPYSPLRVGQLWLPNDKSVAVEIMGFEGDVLKSISSCNSGGNKKGNTDKTVVETKKGDNSSISELI